MTQRTSDGRSGGESAGTSEELMTSSRSYTRGVRTLPTAAAEKPEFEHESTSDDTIPGYRRSDRPSPSEDRSMGLPVESIRRRLERVERQNRWMRLGFLLLLLLGGYAVSDKLDFDRVVVTQTLLESEELKLLDAGGKPRLFLRMYSRVPVLQVLDASGKPRMSLGLRFDDTPFIDLSDRQGRTRATFEMTDEDAPAMRLMDEDGNTTFRIN